jgi:TRAP-type C4-dicarboxylate transport system permease small subunit
VIPRALAALDRGVEWLLLALLAALVAVNGLQVVWRFVLDSPLSWVLEVSILGMVWATMLSGYIGVRRNSHLSADFLGLAASPRVRAGLEIAALVLSLGFLATWGWTSLVVVDAMEGIPFTSIPLTQPVLYASLPVGAALMALAAVAALWQRAAALRNG